MDEFIFVACKEVCYLIIVLVHM